MTAVFPLETGRSIESTLYVHLGHTINFQQLMKLMLLDTRVIVSLKPNNALCYFNKLNLLARIKSFQSVCISMYSCES
jgi:hypothetical protein